MFFKCFLRIEGISAELPTARLSEQMRREPGADKMSAVGVSLQINSARKNRC
jgi:hypothetical protein